MNFPDLEPYIPYSLKLAVKTRRGGGNMFRHQMETLAILLEYGYTNPVLLKAALIHDLLEDGARVNFNSFEEIDSIDGDGQMVEELVTEVSLKVINGVEEPKKDFLHRIMTEGSELAKVLKLADRISNVNALLLTSDYDFIYRYTSETEQCILPFARNINPDMAQELKNSIETILKNL